MSKWITDKEDIFSISQIYSSSIKQVIVTLWCNYKKKLGINKIIIWLYSDGKFKIYNFNYVSLTCLFVVYLTFSPPKSISWSLKVFFENFLFYAHYCLFTLLSQHLLYFTDINIYIYSSSICWAFTTGTQYHSY